MNQLGITDLEVGTIGLGTAWLKKSQSDASEVVAAHLSTGNNLIDTASDYGDGDAEEIIGKVISDIPREEIVLVTKVGHQSRGVKGDEFTPEIVLKNIDKSLQRMKTDYVDVALIHTGGGESGTDILMDGEVMEALSEVRDSGKVRYIGYSGDNSAALYAIRIPVDVVEMSLSIVDQANIQSIEEARENGVGILAKRSISDGSWKGKKRQHKSVWDYASVYRHRLIKMLRILTSQGYDMIDIGLDESDPAWVRLFLSFALSHDIGVALVGTTNPAHAMENAGYTEEIMDTDLLDLFYDSWKKAESADPLAEYGASWKGLG